MKSSWQQTHSHRSHPSHRIKTILLLFLLAIVSLPSHAGDWPQWGGPRHDGIWREIGIVRTFPADGPKVLCRVTIHRGYAGPSVADVRVFVFDRKTPEGAAMPKSAFERSLIPGDEVRRSPKNQSTRELSPSVPALPRSHATTPGRC